MTLALGLDTSGPVGSVALLSDGGGNGAEVLGHERIDRGMKHGVELFPALRRLLQAAGVRASVVQNPEDRVEHDPQSRARNWWVEMEHEEIGTTVNDNVNPRLSATPGALRMPGPLVGQHTFEVMSRVVGMTDAEIVEHQELGVFM